MVIEHIEGMFPVPVTVYETAGMQEGLIVRFPGHEFYLKIYPSKDRAAFSVEGWLMKRPAPIYIDTVAMEAFRRYAALYTHNGIYIAMIRRLGKKFNH